MLKIIFIILIFLIGFCFGSLHETKHTFEVIKKWKKHNEEWADLCKKHNEEWAEYCDSLIDELNNYKMPFEVGDKVAVRALCECVHTIPIYEECRNECPFENDCPCDECDNANERIFVTRIDRIFNDGYGWKVEFRYLGIEASIKDLGTSFFVGENAEQQAEEYEKQLQKGQGE